MEALLLLGRFGVCGDLPILEDHAAQEASPIREAAAIAVRRMRLRLDCTG
jgi:hypothetical protein